MMGSTTQGRMEEALVYAEASRGLNQPDMAIDAAYEKSCWISAEWMRRMRSML